MLETVADIYLTEDVQKLLLNKYIIFIGDSVIRGMYKDLVKLLQVNDHLTDFQLKHKGEFYFENDVLLEGGSHNAMTNDTSYSEVREYRTDYHLVKFYFITRCYSDYLISIAKQIQSEQEKPDVVLMNSGVWDLTRYGPNSIPEYKYNLPLGIQTIIKVLPCQTLFIWCTTLPLSKDIKGGFVVPEIELGKSKLREDVLEANAYAVRVMNEYKLDVIDMHFYFMNQIQRRAKDGIHWDATAHRRISNIILNHIADAYNASLPYRIILNVTPQNSGFKSITNANQIPFELSMRLHDVSLKRPLAQITTEGSDDNYVSVPQRANKRRRSNEQQMEQAPQVFAQNTPLINPTPLMQVNNMNNRGSGPNNVQII